jgi:3-oxoacyl-[acyl-carrier-protein] synthase II
MDIFVQYGLVAAIQAVRDAKLDMEQENAARVGAAFGSGIGGLTNIESNHEKMLAGGPRKLSPFFVPGTIINMISGNLAIMYGMKGPNFATVTACTTGTHNIGFAAQQIMLNQADVMVAGGAEKGSTPLGLGGFAAARALSTRNDDPQAASRPWDKDRDGFVLSDGAGAVVLEEYEHAKARGATIYAELVGFGMSDDAFHITAPAEGGAGAELAMRNALENADVSPESVGYINAHGTSTQMGDLAEVQAIKSLFGEHASQLAVSSTKSMIGHLLGAAGAVEAIITILAMRDSIAPPTINLDNPDEGCDLNLVANKAQQKDIEYGLSNSFGFGGTNGSLLFRKWQA